MEAQLVYKKLTWSELQQKTELSKGALSKHLKEMIKTEQVKAEIIMTSKNQMQTVYSAITLSKDEIKTDLTKPLLEKPNPLEMDQFEYLLNQLQLLAFSSGIHIKVIQDRKQAEAILRDYLDFNLDTISSYIPYFISLANSYSIGYAEGKGKLPIKKQYDVFVKELKEHYIKKIIEPWIDAIAYSIFVNSDITLEKTGQNRFLGQYIESRGKAVDRSFIDRIELIMEENKRKYGETGAQVKF